MEFDSRLELEKFGSALRMHRLSSRISQEGLAAIANIDRSYLSAVERGQHNLALLNIIKIADALGISLGELFSYREGGK